MPLFLNRHLPLYLALIFLILCGLAYSLLMSPDHKLNTLVVHSGKIPTTPDPYEFDLSVNHYGYGPLFIKLFSQYKDARISPSLVKSWSSLSEGKQWRVKIRSDVTFTTGQIVTLFDVERSLKRVLFLAMREGSKLSLLNKLENLSAFKSISSNFSGIEVVGDELIFRFSSPVTSLPEDLSFGLYGIAHSDNWDAVTGEWKNNLPIFSGPYYLESKSDNAFKIKWRTDYPHDLSSEHSAKEILITSEPGLRASADVVDGFLEDQPSREHKFLGNSSSDIVFMYVFSWDKSESLWSDKKFRLAMREAFYKCLDESGHRPVRSFFPLVIPGISEIPTATETYSNADAGQTFRYKPPSNVKVPALKAIKEGFECLANNRSWTISDAVEISLSEMRKIIRKTSKAHLDVASRITSIGSEDPRDTFRFMLSREGIFLPDPDGRLETLTRSADFSLQDANKIMLEQGIVWPLFHLSMGFWVKPFLDLSRYNTSLPLSELQWINVR